MHFLTEKSEFNLLWPSKPTIMKIIVAVLATALLSGCSSTRHTGTTPSDEKHAGTSQTTEQHTATSPAAEQHTANSPTMQKYLPSVLRLRLLLNTSG